MASSITAKEQKTPLNLSQEEKRLFSQVFQAADKEGFGVVTGDVALSFFPQKTKLPVDVLGEIWQIADIEDKGFLTPNGFYIVLRLIGYAQAGRSVNAESATKSGPLPRFEGINGSGPVSAPKPAATLQPQVSGGPIRVPPLLPEKATQYASLFEESGAQNGLLPGATAKQIFDRAQLPNDVLVRIWNLADTEMRGMLSCTEFIIAMHLLASFRSGAMRALPHSLPAGLYEAAARRGIPVRPVSGARSGPGSPPAPATRQLGGDTARTASPSSSQQAYMVPVMQLQTASQADFPAADGWVITATEKVKYDNQFAKLDTSGKGFISGDEAVGFFSKSGLSEHDLAQIWDLADIRSEGRLSRDEFAVAMYLIVQNVQTRAPIPQSLPLDLIPPKMRDSVSDNPKSTAPDFQQPQAATAPKKAQSAAEDLFGLDALSTTTQQTQAAPQIAQSTGGSSAFATPSSPRAAGSPLQSTKISAPSATFKPFQPSSSFGQSIVTPQQTGASSVSQSRATPAPNDDLLGDNDEASQSIGHDSVEIGNLSNQVGTLSSQTTDVKNKRAAADQQLSQASSQKRDIEARLAQLRQTYEQEARDVRSLEENLSHMREENKKLQGDLAMVQHNQQNLTEQHQKVAQQYDADQQENGRLKDQISQVNSEISQMKPMMEKMRSDARQQKGLVAINKKQLATVEAELDRIKTELDLAARDHAEATQELTDIHNKIERVSQECENQSQQLSNQDVQHLVSSNRDREVQSEISPQAAVTAPLTSSVTSPAASVNSMNPFFRRSTNNSLVEKGAITSPNANSNIAVNHSAFDEFFGPAGVTGGTPAPPAASFGAESASSDRAEALTTNEGQISKTSTSTADESRVKIPPSPPRSRQISSGALPLKGDTNKVTSDTSLTSVEATADRLEGASGVAATTENQSLSHELSEPSQDSSSHLREDRAVDKNLSVMQSNDLPGAFPSETPVQSPLHTGADEPSSSALAPQITGNDPFSSNTMTPTSARDDFDSAFVGFTDPSSERPDPTASGNKDARTTEFPPIEHFENDESDSDSEVGFNDNFTPEEHQSTMEHNSLGSKAGIGPPPPADALPSPPDYNGLAKQDSPEVGNDTENAKVPTEFKGLLPSREDPTLQNQHLQSDRHAESAYEAPGHVNAPHLLSQKADVSKSSFDAFDDDFKGLSETQAADENGDTEDPTTSLASRRDTLDEFNPTFDSPASSTRANMASFPETHVSLSSTSFPHSGSIAAPAGAVPQAPTSHDWDAIFTGLDSSGTENHSGASALNEAFGETSRLGGSAAAKPSFTRAISEGTEHDDPILKNLTGMGFSREESLRALEKYDYNINKAADYLTSKS